MSEINNYELNIGKKVYQALSQSDWDGLLVFGYDNVKFLSGTHLPFLPYRPDLRVSIFWPKFGEPIYICPEELESTVRDFGRIQKIETYQSGGYCSDNFIAAISRILTAVCSKSNELNISVDKERESHVYSQKLGIALPQVRWHAADSWLWQLRMNKTTGEQELLSEIAYTTDHAINGYLHHVMKSAIRTMLSMASDIRIHSMERGLDNLGYNSIAQSAGHDKNTSFWPICSIFGNNYGFSPSEKCTDKDFPRASMNSSYDGYWSDACRVFTYGYPDEQQIKAYKQWLIIRNFILRAMKPGVKCCDICNETIEFAKAEGIALAEGLALGHSIGVTLYERPFLDPIDETILNTGMVMIIAPVLILENGEQLHNHDTVVIKEDCSCVVNWWKDWREPYQTE